MGPRLNRNMTLQKTNDQPSVSRREILRDGAACAALTNTSLLSTLLALTDTNAALADTGQFTDYKAMVCVFLYGGNDSYNMLTPTVDEERLDYVLSRGGVETDPGGGLALAEETLLQISDSATGRTFGIHPSMPEMAQLYAEGKLSFLCNVGSLVGPTSIGDFQAGAGLPSGLFSHSDLQRHWMTSVPQSRAEVTGWTGRLADLVHASATESSQISMNLSLGSLNLLQTGQTVLPYVVGADGAVEVSRYGGDSDPLSGILTRSIDDSLSQNYSNRLQQAFSNGVADAIELSRVYNQAVSPVTSTDVFFPAADTNSFESQLKMVAKSIGARQSLGHHRQTFFVGLGGWDNHNSLLPIHRSNLATLSRGLSRFQAAVDDLQMTNDVVTFTASDFGRTLSSNGRGTDHGWGGNQIVMGGPVVGGKLHGDYPTSLAPGNPLDIGRGRLLPTTSVDEIAAELALWFGANNDSTLEAVLPNLRRFVTPGIQRPMGFLA